MSSLTFPTLPEGLRVTRSVEYVTSIQRAVSGKELRIRRQTTPRRRFVLHFEGLRVDGSAQVATLLDFIHLHAGSYDSFLFNDPLVPAGPTGFSATPRVRFVSDAIELERVVNLVWAVGEVELLEVL